MQNMKTDVPSLEGFDTIIEYIKEIFDIKKTGATSKDYGNKSTLKTIKHVEVDKKLIKYLRNLDEYKDLEEVYVSTPTELTSYWLPYVETLNKCMHAHEDIVERLYEPLIEFFSDCVSKPKGDFFPPRLSLVDIEHQRNEIGKFFAQSKGDRNAVKVTGREGAYVSGESLFFNVFKEPTDLERTINTIDDAVSRVREFRRKELIDSEERLLELSIKANNINSFDRLSVKEKNKLVAMVRDVADQTRTLGAIIYQIDVSKTMIEKTQAKLALLNLY